MGAFGKIVFYLFMDLDIDSRLSSLFYKFNVLYDNCFGLSCLEIKFSFELVVFHYTEASCCA